MGWGDRNWNLRAEGAGEGVTGERGGGGGRGSQRFPAGFVLGLGYFGPEL